MHQVNLLAMTILLLNSVHRHCAITVPSLHHHCAITAPSLHHHCTITAPSPHHHRTITTQAHVGTLRKDANGTLAVGYVYGIATGTVTAPSPSLHHHCTITTSTASRRVGSNPPSHKYTTMMNIYIILCLQFRFQLHLFC